MKFYLIAFILSFCSPLLAQNAKPAGELFQQALGEAASSQRHIILVFTSTWCGPCKDLRKLLNDSQNKSLFETNYVILELYNTEIGENTVNQNPGTDSLIVKYDADSTSIPFWMILDPKGKKLYDSYEYTKEHGIKRRSNTGFSLTSNYLHEFLALIKKTSYLTNKEIAMIHKRGMQLSKLRRDQY